MYYVCKPSHTPRPGSTLYWTGIPMHEWVYNDSPTCLDVQNTAKVYNSVAECYQAMREIRALYATRGSTCAGLTFERTTS